MNHRKYSHPNVATKHIGQAAWVGAAALAAAILAAACLGGCGTVRGLITSFEATSAGLAQDMRGAVNGIERADSGDPVD